ncbi:MAG: RnfABCDGE type electron transport complex subunit B [Nitrospirae bacterium]|nr:MAG: RnfABCDGE type electron transport complex subunit B [Nitrospirota bacterium]
MIDQAILKEIFGLIGNLNLPEFINHIPLPHVGVGGGIEAKESVDFVETLKFTLLFIFGVGAVFGMGLAFAAKKFSVKRDPRIDQVREHLAGAHCGACGYPGCEQYAEAVVQNPDVPPNLCTPGGEKAAKMVALITGKEAVATEPKFSRIMCQGDWQKATKRFKYEGVEDCRAAVLAGGGDKSCIYGCLGYGTCEKVCPFDAIHMNENHLPVVDVGKCTGCRKCEAACPKKVIEVLPGSKAVVVACHSRDRGADTRKNCQIGCIACGACEKVCPFDAAHVEGNVSRIDYDKCRVCGLCVRKCPTKAIVDHMPTRPKAFIVEEKCIGCNACMKVCPVNAAYGELKKVHTIDQSKCIGCGICTARCPKQAIDGTFNAQEVFRKAEEKKKAKVAA